MITSTQEYYNNLWKLNSFNRPTDALLVPKSEKIYTIDLNSRTISGPEILSVSKDHRAEMIYFVVDRYYEHFDLAKTTCVISYTNKTTKKSSFYVVPFYDLSNTYGKKEPTDETDLENKSTILFPWCIEGLVTEEAGDVEYAVRFYATDENTGTVIYSMNTIPTTGKVLYGLSYSDFEYSEIPATDIERLEDEIAQLRQWKDLFWDIVE